MQGAQDGLQQSSPAAPSQAPTQTGAAPPLSRQCRMQQLHATSFYIVWKL